MCLLNRLNEAERCRSKERSTWSTENVKNVIYYQLKKEDDSTVLNPISLIFITFQICVKTSIFSFIANNHAQKYMLALPILQMRQARLKAVTHLQSYIQEITGQDQHQLFSFQSPCSFFTPKLIPWPHILAFFYQSYTCNQLQSQIA